MDNHTKEQRHKNMQAVKNRNSLLEQKVSKYLRSKGIYFRKNVKDLPGKPDIAIKKYKLVIFIDSCFWHKCPIHYKAPRTNTEFWERKIQGNSERDIEITELYKNKKWHILRIWEHDLKNDFEQTMLNVENFIISVKNF